MLGVNHEKPSQMPNSQTILVHIHRVIQSKQIAKDSIALRRVAPQKL